MSEPNSSLQLIIDTIEYSPITGEFFWKIDRGTRFKAGTKIKCNINDSGYERISINGRQYRAHRIAYIIMTGRKPEYIDHIDGNRSNNRWCNLRNVTASQNQRNTTITHANSGHKNIILHKSNYKNKTYIGYVVSIMHDGGTYNKYFKELHKAIEHRNHMLIELHGEYANRGQTIN